MIQARIEQEPKELGQSPYPWPRGGDREVERAEILIDMPSLKLDIFRTSLCPSPLTSLRYTYDVFS